MKFGLNNSVLLFKIILEVINLKIRIEFEDKKELDKVIEDLKNLYDLKNISKVYSNRPPSKMKRIYIDFNVYK